MPKMHEGRRYDLWYADPFRYHQVLNQLGENQVFLTMFGLKRSKQRDPYDWMHRHFQGKPWKCLCSDGTSAILIDNTCERYQQKGVFPVWNFRKFNLRELEDYVKNPWSQRTAAAHRWEMIPNPLQPHRIIIDDMGIGAVGDNITQNRVRKLTEIQRQFPEVEFLVKPRSYNPGLMFGKGFTAGAVDLWEIIISGKGTMFLPNGSRIRCDEIHKHEKNVEYFGFSADELEKNQMLRVQFNAITSRYAAHHWDDPTGPMLLRGPNKRGPNRPPSMKPDTSNPDMYAAMPSYERIVAFRADEAKPNDKIICDGCSLWRKCPAYRPEEVCNLPASETSKLVKLAKSRNADDIVEMLGAVLEKQASRVEEMLSGEDKTEGLDPAVDKALNNLFKNGVTLAKIRNPALQRPMVQINQGKVDQNQIVAQADPRELAAAIVADIEAQGIPRDQITDAMIESHMAKMAEQQQLEASVQDAEVVDLD